MKLLRKIKCWLGWHEFIFPIIEQMPKIEFKSFMKLIYDGAIIAECKNCNEKKYWGDICKKEMNANTAGGDCEK